MPYTSARRRGFAQESRGSGILDSLNLAFTNQRAGGGAKDARRDGERASSGGGDGEWRAGSGEVQFRARSLCLCALDGRTVPDKSARKRVRGNSRGRGARSGDGRRMSDSEGRKGGREQKKPRSGEREDIEGGKKARTILYFSFSRTSCTPRKENGMVGSFVFSRFFPLIYILSWREERRGGELGV